MSMTIALQWYNKSIFLFAYLSNNKMIGVTQPP